MKAVTFNIRCDIQPKSEAEFREMLASLPDGVKAPAVRFPKGDGVNAWEYRKALDVRAIRRASPEVVGFQEILPHMGLYLRRELPGYTFLGHGREKDYGGERPMVAVREDVEILAYRCFWLSPTPDEPGSRFPVQSPCPRTCAVVKLRLPDGLIFRLYDTHLDHLCPEAREAGLKQLLAVMTEDNRQEPLPMMLMGDFNADPGSAEMAPIRENTLGLRDLTAETGPTFHGYGNPEEFIKIDYIFATEPFVSAHTATRLWTQVTDKGTYLSDHYPVEADFELK